MAEAKWLEVSLSVDGELAEAVAEVLDRFTSGGVVVESNVRHINAEDMGTPFGPLKVFGYLVIDQNIDSSRCRLEEALWHLNTIRELPQPVYKEIADENWMAAWKDHYHPIPIGKRLLVLPAWIKQQDMSRLAVKIDPSMAFGTGTHPSTQLCMELVEDYTRPGEDVIDVGCGSGILSIAAVKMGAGHALGVDIDPESIKSTLENSHNNDVDAYVESGLGSVEEVRSGTFSIQVAPLVLANILAPVLISLFEGGLADLISPRGVIVLAGILSEQGDNVRTAAERAGLHFIEQRQSSDWVALVMKKLI